MWDAAHSSDITCDVRYQSSLDLGQETYAAIRHLPLAGELVKKSRQQLVQHLDDYCDHHNALFKQVPAPKKNFGLRETKLSDPRCGMTGMS